MSPETRLNGLHFCRHSMGLSSFIFCGGLRKSHLFWNRMRIGRSRSSKVVDVGTNRKGVRDFLLVINSNFGPILHRFWDTASYWLKIANFSYPTLVWRPRSRRTRQDFWMKLIAEKLEGWGYCMVKIAWSYLQPFLTDPPVWRTDGRTDRRNCDSICALSIYAVARKKGDTILISSNIDRFKKFSLAHVLGNLQQSYR